MYDSKRANAIRTVCASGGMVDALASGASVPRDVEVRVFSRVPNKIVTIWPLFYLENIATDNLLQLI
jgi:hypothetical protein